MDLAVIVDMIVAQATIWAPALTAIVGIIITLIPAYKEIKKALNDISATNKEVRKTKELEQLHADLRQAHQDNKEMRDMLSATLDKLAGIENYSEKVGITHERENKDTKN